MASLIKSKDKPAGKILEKIALPTVVSTTLLEVGSYLPSFLA
jgi:hypothetical protein